MKKISTLAIMVFFFCLGSMAQVLLGDINFSLKEGQKINPTTGKITVTFPNVTGIADPTTTSFVMTGAFNDIDFDGIEGTFATGVVLDLAEFELQPATDYALKITSVKVDGTELAPAEGYTLNFKTRGTERKMSWSFAIDDASLEMIAADAADNADGDVAKYIDITKNNAPRYYVPARNYEEIMLPNGTVLPATEDLTFKFGEKVFYVSGHAGNWADAICFNGNNQFMVIPDCHEGDVITFNANRATSGNASKQTCIQALNGAALAVDGLVSSTGIQDSIWLGSSFMNFKFEVQADGDLTFRFGNCILKSVQIAEAQEKKPCKYNIVAAYVTEENTTILKELVAETEAMSGSTVKTQFPYWLKDAEGNVYQHAAISKEFNVAFELNSDTTFVMEYSKTDIEGALFLSEGEDLPGAVECTSGNAAVRSSMGKAGYVTEDLKLVTLQPGTYKIRAILFDANKEPVYICTLTKGEGEENEIYLSATATNWTNAESDLLTITEATDIILKAGGGDNQGIDVILIYAATEDPDGIVELKANAQKTVRKVAKSGQVLIETEAGIFNALGVQMK
jgi:hypothetical protein